VESKGASASDVEVLNPQLSFHITLRRVIIFQSFTKSCIHSFRTMRLFQWEVSNIVNIFSYREVKQLWELQQRTQSPGSLWSQILSCSSW